MTVCSPLTIAAESLAAVRARARCRDERCGGGGSSVIRLAGIRTRGAAVRPAENGSTATRADCVPDDRRHQRRRRDWLLVERSQIF